MIDTLANGSNYTSGHIGMWERWYKICERTNDPLFTKSDLMVEVEFAANILHADKGAVTVSLAKKGI
jgi:hypothetical protein